MYCKEGKNNHSNQTVVRTVYWIVYWIGRATHSASGAEGQMVHLLGEGPHHVGWLHGYGVVHGWRNHSTLWVGTHAQYAVPCLDNLLHKGNALTHTQPHLHSHAPPVSLSYNGMIRITPAGPYYGGQTCVVPLQQMK